MEIISPFKKKAFWLLYLILIFSFLGCASGKKNVLKVDKQNLDNIIAKNELGTSFEKLKKHIQQIKKDFKVQTRPNIEQLKTKINLNIKDAPLKDVFKVIAEKGKFGLVFDFDEKLNEDNSTVTAYFNNLSINQVIQKIAESHDLIYDFHNNILTVKNYHAVHINLPIFFFKDQATFKIGNDLSINVDNKLKDEISDDLNAIFDSKGQVIINTQTGELILKSTPQRIKLALDYLENLRDQLMQYVFVKMYIVKVNTNKAKEYGIDFSRLTTFKGKDFHFKLSPGIPTASSLSIGLSNNNLNLLLQAIEQEGIGYIVSNPFFMIRNNTVAGLRVVTQIGWVEPGDIETVTGGNTSNTSQGRPEFKTKDVGTVLMLEPKILSDKAIQVLLNIQDTTLDKFLTYPWQPYPGMQSITLQYPLISTREFVTQLIAHSGDYIIIGGFKEQRKNTTETNYPFIKDIPVLNKLSQYSQKQIDNKDLYIIMKFFTI